MARYTRNRSSKEIIAFLEAHGFTCYLDRTDDVVYTKEGWKLTCKVTVNQKSTPIGTMGNIIRCSGYSRKYWINWWKNNGFGK